jgi:hypothetical protein
MSLQALLPDNVQDSLNIFNYIVVPKFLKAMTWFHGAFPHPLVA